MKRFMFSAIAAGFIVAPAMGGDLLWENPDTNGINGVSNATEAPFGFRRQVLDDFELAGASTITSIEWNHIWNILPPGSGTGLELRFREDNGGTPGSIIGSGYVNVTDYTETSTGRSWFGRQEAAAVATFDGVSLDAGTYWIDATVVGPENNFWMVSDIATLEPMWVDYADFGGLQPGFNIFGDDYELDFALFGTAGGGVTLDVTGPCPGTMTATVNGATPNGTVAFIYAFGTGNAVIPSGPCQGTQLGLNNTATLLGTDQADGNGVATLSGNAPPAACGNVFLQALDVPTCGTSNVIGI